MDIKKLNTICYTICIVCIVLGALFAIFIIWGEVENEIVWKGWLTIAVFFLASLLTFSVNKMLEKRNN